MTTVSALALQDFNHIFIVKTNASRYRLGAVLIQNQWNVTYFNQMLTARARLKSVYGRKLMVIVLVIQKWWPYFLGRHFIIRMDQRSLKFLLEQRMMTVEHQRWLYKLLWYDFEIKYRLELENNEVDALSRNLMWWQYHFLWWWIGRLWGKSAQDKELSKIRVDLLTDSASHLGYSL